MTKLFFLIFFNLDAYICKKLGYFHDTLKFSGLFIYLFIYLFTSFAKRPGKLTKQAPLQAPENK